MARKMKDSGVEWIGEIPIGWGTPKIINRFDFIGSGTTPRTYEDNYYVDGEINWIQSGDLHDKYLISTSKKITQMAFDRTSALKMYFPQYLVMAMYGASVGNLSIATIEACTNQACCVLTGEKDHLRYMYYVLMAAKEYLVYSAIGGTQPNISQNVIKNLRIPIPMIVEQQKIAYVLDKKFEELDNVLEKTRASIEEYRKLKQAVITQAVTKGIRGNREMKDSGVEWIGTIPTEWGLIPFRHVLKERQEKNSPIKSVERLSLSIDLGVTLYAEKTTNLDRFKEDFEQYKLAHEGDLVMNSMNMIVGATGVSDYFGCVSPVYYTFYDELEDHVTAKYCEYIFRSKTMLRVLYSLGKGIYAIVRGDDRVNTCRLKVSKEDLKSIIIPVPPVEEQREIVSYLGKKCEEIDKIIAKKEQYLSEIENYKKSLIYEYVTGKKEVPQKYQA